MNLRPPVPQTGALTRLRYAPTSAPLYYALRSKGKFNSTQLPDTLGRPYLIAPVYEPLCPRQVPSGLRFDRMRIALTDRRINRLPKAPTGSRLEVYDLCVPGLIVRVTDRGVKSFCVRYRIGARSLRFTIGKPGPISTQAARKIALRVLAEAAQGVDPMQPKREGRDRDTSPSVSLPVSSAIERFVCDWLPNRVSEGALKPAYAAECTRLLRKEVMPRWSDKCLASVTALDLTDLLAEINARSTRRHTYFAIRTLCRWAEGSGILRLNPIPKNYPNPAKPKGRERVLRADETRRIWQHVHKGASQFHSIVALLLLTGQRRDEVADAKWSEFDVPAQTWTIPGERVKNGRTHIVPLTDTAIRLLTVIPRTSPYLFPGTGGKRATFSGWSRSKARLDRQIDVTGWTLHDLRRTVATRLSEGGVSPHIVERLLNHSSGIVSGVAAVYNRASYKDEVRAAVTLWADYLSSLEVS